MTTDAIAPPAEEAAAPPAPPPEPLRPTTAMERVETIDILRGMALFGILAANIRAFAGPALTYFLPHLFWTGFPDRLAQAFVDTFIQGKFITIFAFLFGVGFAVQFERASQRGAKFGWRFAWRMLLLMTIGLIHGLLIWFGDILLVYAISGLLLLAFRKRRDTTVKVWAVVFLLIAPLMITAMFIAAQSGVEMPGPKDPSAAEIAHDANVYGNGSFAEVTALRMDDAFNRNWKFLVFYAWHIVGLFLLGVLAWRRRFFEPSPESLPRYRMWMWIGLFLGVAGNAATVIYRWMFNPAPMSMELPVYLLGLQQNITTPALSLGYICFVILLCQSEASRKRLHRFAAVGRTALTNYLLQSLIGTLIFYGYGLGFLGTIGPAWLLLATVAIFAVQMYASPWWLRRYRYGPVEWAWRRMTYGGPLPMRKREAVSLPEAALVPE